MGLEKTLARFVVTVKKGRTRESRHLEGCSGEGRRFHVTSNQWDCKNSARENKAIYHTPAYSNPKGCWGVLEYFGEFLTVHVVYQLFFCFYAE